MGIFDNLGGVGRGLFAPLPTNTVPAGYRKKARPGPGLLDVAEEPGRGVLGLKRNELLAMGAGLLAGDNFSEGIGLGLQGIATNRRRDQDNAYRRQAAAQQQANADRAHALQQQRLAASQNAPTGTMREYQLAQNQGFQGTLQDWILAGRRAGATNLNVNSGPTIPQYSRLPAGYVYRRSQDGQIQINEDGAPTALPIPGGPAAIKAEETAAMKAKAQQNRKHSGGIVLEDIDRAIDIIENGGMLNGAGPPSLVTRHIPWEEGFAVAKLMDTIKANAGFDKLQQMREASPTGGALGAVSDFEVKNLQATIGNLDQAQDDATVLHNLRRIRKIYGEIVHGPDANAQGPTNAVRKGVWQDLGGGVRIQLE